MDAEPRQPDVRRVVKLGGASITDKGSFETLNGAVLHAVAAQLAGVVTEGGGTVIVHGAGSFGHFQASKYGVSKGWKLGSSGSGDRSQRARQDGREGEGRPPPALLKGFCETRQSVTNLNREVVQALIKAGVPAVGLPLLGSWETEGRRVSRASSGLEVVADLLRMGAVPVLHGDAVLDTELGCTILSGDVVIERLAERFRPQQVVFLTDVPGVFDRPPSHAGARRIPSIRVRGGRVLKAGDMRMESAAHDVTGGMETKVASAAKIVASCGGGAVYIAKAGTEDGMRAMLAAGGVPAEGAAPARGEEAPWEGTVVRRDDGPDES